MCSFAHFRHTQRPQTSQEWSSHRHASTLTNFSPFSVQTGDKMLHTTWKTPERPSRMYPLSNAVQCNKKEDSGSSLVCGGVLSCSCEDELMSQNAEMWCQHYCWQSRQREEICRSNLTRLWSSEVANLAAATHLNSLQR